MPRMKGGRYGCGGPGPNVPRPVVEGPEDRIGPEGRVERDDIAHRADAAIGPARASKEGFRRIPDDLRRPQGRDSLPFDGTPIGLPLMAVERSSIVCDLERNAHAKGYLSYDISSDRVATIPAADPYPILNLSHAVTILLYELFTAGAHGKTAPSMSGLEK